MRAPARQTLRAARAAPAGRVARAPCAPAGAATSWWTTTRRPTTKRATHVQIHLRAERAARVTVQLVTSRRRMVVGVERAAGRAATRRRTTETVQAPGARAHRRRARAPYTPRLRETRGRLVSAWCARVLLTRARRYRALRRRRSRARRFAADIIDERVARVVHGTRERIELQFKVEWGDRALGWGWVPAVTIVRDALVARWRARRARLYRAVPHAE